MQGNLLKCLLFHEQGGGFALSTAAKKENSDLNGKIGEFLKQLSNFPNAVVLLIIIIFTIFVTNFASNVAVCNVIAPIAMELVRANKLNEITSRVLTLIIRFWNLPGSSTSSYTYRRR